MKLGKCAISIALALNMFSIPAFAASVSFTDVPTSHWAHDSITEMADRGVIKGVGDNKFAPNGTVTYAEFITMLTREFYGAKDTTAPEGNEWYTPYLAIAENKQLLEGCKDLAPTSVIDRFDMAQVMYNHMKQTGAEIPDGADPSTIADWSTVPENYQEAVSVCYAMKLLQGKDDNGMFDGTGTMNRAEAATVVDRLINGDSAETPTQPEQPSTPEAPSGSLKITDASQIVSIPSAPYGDYDKFENGVFYTRKDDSKVCAHGGFIISNPGYSKITFTVTVHEDPHAVCVRNTGSVRDDIRYLTEWPNDLQPEETKTITADISGLSKVSVGAASGSYSNAEIFNIYLHN